MYRIDKITLLFNRGNLTSKLDVIKTLSHTNSVQDKGKHRFMSYCKCSQCLPPAFTLSRPLSKTRVSFVLQKIVPCFLPCNF